MYMFVYIYTNSTMEIFSKCYINIDVSTEAMEPAITTPTLHPTTILGTTTIFLPYLKDISNNYL